MIKKSVNYVFILSILFSIMAPISSDLYLPSLPSIAASFHVDISLVQLSIAIFVLGVSIARLILSTLSDAIGRKIVVIISLLICLVGCVLCLYSTDIYMLLIGRFLQGFGAGGSNVAARVILRDSVEGKKLARYNSYFSMINISLMAGAPLLGGYLESYFGWHSSFQILLIYTCFALFVGIFILPESNQYRGKHLLKLSTLKQNFKALFVCPSFIIYALFLMLGYGAIVAWVTAGPIVLQKNMLFTPIEFGWCAFLVAFCYFMGAYLNSKFVCKFGMQRMLQFGVGCFFLASVLSFIFYSFDTPITFIMPVMLALFGIAMVIPNSFAAGLTPFAKTAGLAMAILGSIQIVGGVVTSTIISVSSNHNRLSMALLMLISSVICMVLVRSKSISEK